MSDLEMLWREYWYATLRIVLNRNAYGFYTCVWLADDMPTGFGDTPNNAELDLLGQLGCF